LTVAIKVLFTLSLLIFISTLAGQNIIVVAFVVVVVVVVVAQNIMSEVR